MKTIHITLLFFATTILGCKRDEQIIDKSPLQPVFAGKVNSEMQYVDFMPDLDLDTLSIPPSIDYNFNSLEVDLNKDNMNDISMSVSRDNTANCGIVFYSLSSASNKIGFSCLNVNCGWVSGIGYKNCSGVVTSIPFGVKIEHNTCKWSITTSRDSDNDSLRNVNYPFKYYYSYDTTNWQPTINQYIGYRFINNTDTLYGWMRFSLLGKAHMVIHDLAYQKSKS